MLSPQQQEYAFKFTGNGQEYFKIWIVNLVLTILTLGIYSAWAKVRRMQYFYRNTQLADSSFEYHGTPLVILKGRIIAGCLFLAYVIAGELEPLAGLALFVLIGATMPWLIVRSLRFKLHNSSYRGLRFAFSGGNKEAYTVFLLFPILTMLTFNLLAPFTHQRIKRYQHRNSTFGTTSFNFNASENSFYRIYFTALGIGFLVFMLATVFFLASTALPTGAQIAGIALVPVLFAATFLLITSYWTVSISNLVWNSTGLGEHTFFSRLSVRSYLWIGFTNLLGILFTLGLYTPFAVVRMMRYRLEHMGMMAQSDLTEFVAGQQQQISAVGEEAVEMFDIDISL